MRTQIWRTTAAFPPLLSYLLNPFTILSCVAKSTCALNNAVLALFFLATIKGQPCFQSLTHTNVPGHERVDEA